MSPVRRILFTHQQIIIVIIVDYFRATHYVLPPIPPHTHTSKQKLSRCHEVSLFSNSLFSYLHAFTVIAVWLRINTIYSYLDCIVPTYTFAFLLIVRDSLININLNSLNSFIYVCSPIFHSTIPTLIIIHNLFDICVCLRLWCRWVLLTNKQIAGHTRPFATLMLIKEYLVRSRQSLIDW